VNEAVFAAISAGVILLVAVAVLRGSGRRVATTRVLWVAGTAIAVIALLTTLRLAVNDAIRIAAVGLVGLAMSGVLIWLALRYGADLENAHTRRLIALAAAGVIITVLGAVVEFSR